MLQFSLFRYREFLLTWQVHVAAVAVMICFALWWGVSRWPWYVGATAFCAILWLFVPLQAPEPVLALLPTVPLLAFAFHFCQQRWATTQPADATPQNRSRWRFGLRDLLMFNCLAGLTIALLLQCWRWKWHMHWPDEAISFVCIAAISLSVFLVDRQTTVRRQLFLLPIVIALIGVSTVIHFFFVRRDWLLMSDWEGLSSPNLGARGDIVIVYLLTFAELIIPPALAASILLPPATPWSRRKLVASRSVASGLLLLISLGLGAVYITMLRGRPWPVESFPAQNERDALWAIAERHEALNPQSESVATLELRNPDLAAEVASLFAQLVPILERDQITLFDSRYDQAEMSMSMEHISAARNLARALAAQADAEWSAGRREEALSKDRLTLQLGQVFQRRCTIVDAMVGVIMQNIAMHHYAVIRSELTCDESTRIRMLLDAGATQRESLNLLAERDLVHGINAYGWRERFRYAVKLLCGLDVHDSRLYYQNLVNQQDTWRRLLVTDLALRCYRADHGVWPASLDELVPQYLPQVPVDLYTTQPLIYLRGDADQFELYSTGDDRQDNGGHSAPFFAAGSDLSLDGWISLQKQNGS